MIASSPIMNGCSSSAMTQKLDKKFRGFLVVMPVETGIEFR
jgi:hypothetical protein